MAVSYEVMDKNLKAIHQHGEETRRLLREAEAKCNNYERQLQDMSNRLAQAEQMARTALAVAQGGGSTSGN